jgi:hypothetical protein
LVLLNVERKVNKRGTCSIDVLSKQGENYQEGGKYFYLTQGEHINQNPTETYSETVDE